MAIRLRAREEFADNRFQLLFKYTYIDSITDEAIAAVMPVLSFLVASGSSTNI